MPPAFRPIRKKKPVFWVIIVKPLSSHEMLKQIPGQPVQTFHMHLYLVPCRNFSISHLHNYNE